jgi:catechol 2,3-dioxygenase-like lactoylglutathione lyase family enzyme
MSSASVSQSEKPALGSARLVGFAAISDPARSKAFYREMLGLQFVSEDGFAVVFDCNGVMLRLSIVQKPVLVPYTVLGWEVSDIAAKVRELSARGVCFERYSFMPQDDLGIWTAPGNVARVAWFKDPDGNVLSLSQHQ